MKNPVFGPETVQENGTQKAREEIDWVNLQISKAESMPVVMERESPLSDRTLRLIDELWKVSKADPQPGRYEYTLKPKK